jgi:hypothetical protein
MRVISYFMEIISYEIFSGKVSDLTTFQREISGSHGPEYEDDCLLGYCTVYSLSAIPDDGGSKAPLKRRSLSTRLNCATSHKTAIFTVFSGSKSNLDNWLT